VSASVVNGADGLGWLEKYLSKGAGTYSDVIGYHFYLTPKPPETVVDRIHEVRQIMAKYGISEKPLWNTEAGWSEPKFTSEEAAAYVARSYILNWTAGVSRFYWYAWDNQNYVTLHLTEADSKTLTPAAVAYAEVQKWLVGAQMSSCETNTEKTWTCQLTRDRGYAAWIMWNPERQLSFQVPQNWGVQQLRDLTGAKRNLSASTRLDIGSSPVLLERLAR
jgi:hypothetical protein